MEDAKVTLKLLIEVKAGRVLFAEANKDFVDFLFFLLTLPIGTIMKLLGKESMVGSLGNLYGSIENFSKTYMQPNLSKQLLLNPIVPLPTDVPLLLSNSATCKKVSKCYVHSVSNSSHLGYVAEDGKAPCTRCGGVCSARNISNNYERREGATSGGFVMGLVTYMVMDDLVVKPMSTVSSIAWLNNYGARSLEERVVYVGMAEGLKLLKTSLHSKNNVLTKVFLA